MRLKYLFVILLAVSVNAGSEETIPSLDKNTQKELRCMELNLHFEARGEGHRGMLAVGMVTINRTRSDRFPDSVCRVVKQPGQFSWYENKSYSHVKVSREIRLLAYEILILNKHKDLTGGSLYFHNKTVKRFNRKIKLRLGNHIFYA